jgi:hypothetical protein
MAILESVLCLGAIAKLQKAAITFVVSVCLSVHIEELCCHSTDCRKVWYLSIFRETVQKTQILLRSNKSNKHFAVYIFDHISLSSS